MDLLHYAPGHRGSGCESRFVSNKSKIYPSTDLFEAMMDVWFHALSTTNVFQDHLEIFVHYYSDATTHCEYLIKKLELALHDASFIWLLLA